MKLEELKSIDGNYKEVEERIVANKKKKWTYNICHKIFKILTFVAGASITLFIGLKIPAFDKYCLIISTCITLLTAIEGLFNFRSKAMAYDLLLYELRRLRNEICYEYLKSPQLYKPNKETHFLQLQNILSAKKEIIEDSFEDQQAGHPVK